MWKRLADKLAFTRNERNVILFLTVTLMAGVGARLYRQAFPDSLVFDYRTSDSTFAALSTAIQQGEADSTRRAPRTFGKLDLNRATKAELMDLPGIGEVTAERIILTRDEKGRFRSVGELTKIKGITKKKLDMIKALLTVD